MEETLATRLTIEEVKGEVCVTLWNGAQPVSKIFLAPRLAYFHATYFHDLSTDLLRKQDEK